MEHEVLELDVPDLGDVRQQRIKGGTRVTRVDIDVARFDRNLGGHFGCDEDAPCSRHYRMFPTVDGAVGGAVTESGGSKRKPSARPAIRFGFVQSASIQRIIICAAKESEGPIQL